MLKPPPGPENLDCPWWQKPMSECCQRCPLWTQIRGTNPQTGQEVDTWNCSLAMLPMLLIEGANMTRQARSSIDELRNENQRAQGNLVRFLNMPSPSKMLG